MDALALLTLQIEWGADEALEDVPVDRLRAPETAQPAPPPRAVPPSIAVARPAVPAAAPAVATPAGSAAERAVAAAGVAGDLDALRAAIAGFSGCALRHTATNPVLPQGDVAAGLLLIGDPPGADEDRSGSPFAGEDGALLDRMLASIRLTRAELLMAHLIPWRPPGGRPPNDGELAVCLPFLHRLIVLAEPSHILLLGPFAVRTLLSGKRRRPGGGWVELAAPGLTQPIPSLVLPTPHMVRTTPSVRRDSWAELRRLRRRLDEKLAAL